MLKHKILIADDHAMIRDGIKSLLKRNKDYLLAGEAHNGVQAVEKYKALQPDLIILDISMPDLNGMDAAQKILKDDPGARIIILSMYDDEEYISQCMEFGVMGYVVKNESGTELDFAIKSVLQGRTYFSNQVQNVIFRKYSTNLARKREKETLTKLTAREKEIVKLIAEGLTSAEMAEKLFLSPRTIETHRANLMKKVNAKNSMDLVNRLEKMGLI